MPAEEESCGKKTCKNAGSCLFGFAWEVVAFPFVCLYGCTKYTCTKCCCCCKKNDENVKT